MKNGILDSLFQALQNNPSIAAGTCTFAVAFALVAGNVFYAQSGNHPDPIWATRDYQTTDSIIPTVKQVKISKYAPKKIPTPLTADGVRDGSSKPKPSKLVASIQQALANSGDFSGEIDGLIGPVTRSAIESYQARNKLKTTGIPTAELLRKINRGTPKTVGSAGKDDLSSLISEQSASVGIADRYDHDVVMKIQEAISNSGIANIEADGIFGSRTEAAIKNFQRRNSLDVTGKPDNRLLKKLKTLGLV